MVSPLERAIDIMDRLRSPGGCPWDAAQTHESLTRYLLEEAYEVIEAIETADAELLREELGDLLLQVLFHARIAQEEGPEHGFDIEDVAQDLGDKLIRRHPHVFGASAGRGSGAAEDTDLDEAWEQQKIVEKQRTSVADGVPIDQPALALAAKLCARGRRAGLLTGAGAAPAAVRILGADTDGKGGEAELGSRLLALVAEAVASGIDPEAALRRQARELRLALIEAENTAAAGTDSPEMSGPDR